LRIEWMLNDRTPDFVAENVDCAIQVGALTDPSVVAVLLAEVPELLERTYRTGKDARDFQLSGATPGKFLGRDGVTFTYVVTDADGLTRKGEARAAIIEGKLYMVTFDAPRLHYFDLLAEDARALMNSATL